MCFRDKSKTVIFQILGGSGRQFILEGVILRPRWERDGAPKSAQDRFIGEAIFRWISELFKIDKNAKSREKWRARGV